MKKQLLLFLFAFALITSCNTNISPREDDEIEEIPGLEQWYEQQRFADRILSDPTTFDMDFKTEQDSLGITITESPDGNVRLYSWWDGSAGTMICYDNICQTRCNNKIRAYDWRDIEEEETYYPGFPLAIRQVESEEGAVYLFFYVFTEWRNCRYFGVRALKMDKRGELIPANVFDYSDGIALPEDKKDVVISNRLGVEFYGSEPMSLNQNNGWGDNFFFDLTGEDIYIPYLEGASSFSKYASFTFNEYFEHYHWDGEKFKYSHLTYNPAKTRYIEPSYQLACEMEFGNKFIQIERMFDGTYRYVAWSQEKMFADNPELVIESGWYHEVEKQFHFTNNDYEYVLDASKDQLHIYRTDSKTGKTQEIALYDVYVYSQILGLF